MKYRKKPVVIDAVQWTGNNVEEISQFMDTACDWQYHGDNNNKRLSIETLEGTMAADQHDWIIKGIAGEFYPCKPNIFGQTYNPHGGMMWLIPELIKDLIASIGISFKTDQKTVNRITPVIRKITKRQGGNHNDNKNK